MTPQWIEPNVVFAVHEQQIAEHGGHLGIRDVGLIQSALARPKNIFEYEAPDIFDLAAAYGYDIARNRGFIDGNKRIAYVITRLFLVLNGYGIFAPSVEKVVVFEGFGKGSYSQESLASWLRDHCEPRL